MRVTYKDFIKKVERLEQFMNIPLETNVWHKHFSVYTKDLNGSQKNQIVCSDNAKGAISQIEAILSALHALNF